MLRITACLIVALITANFSVAQPGTIDSAFAGRGYKYFPPRTTSSNVQADGKFIVAKTVVDSLYLLRYKADGTTDSSFGVNGILGQKINESLNSAGVVLQPDGRMFVWSALPLCDSGCTVVARLLADGKPDLTFNGGKFLRVNEQHKSFRIYSIAYQRDGKIVLGGMRTYKFSEPQPFALSRITADGKIDASFGNAGMVETYFGATSFLSGITVQSDGKILAVGYSSSYNFGRLSDSLAIARYNTNGTLDSSFNKTGRLTRKSLDPKSTIDISHQGSSGKVVKELPGGKILIGGVASYDQSHGRWFHGYCAVLKLHPNGIFDSSFANNGIQLFDIAGTTNEVSSMSVQSDGKIVVAGPSGTIDYMNSYFAMARLNSDGILDNDFGNGGKVIWGPPDEYADMRRSMVSSLSLSNSRIYLGGSADSNTVAAFKNDSGPLNPAEIKLCPPQASVNLYADKLGKNYQWQFTQDSVFNTLTDNDNFSGTKTSALFLKDIPSSFNGARFRCIIDNTNSKEYTLIFSNQWTGTVDNAWENPSNWICGTVPDENTSVEVNAGKLVVNATTKIRSLSLGAAASATVKTGHQLIILD